MDESGDESQGSCSDDEPLVPDQVDEDFYTTLTTKIGELTKVVRQKDGQDSADWVQRILICCNRYKSNYHQQEMRCEELTAELENVNQKLSNSLEMSRLDQDTIKELQDVIESSWKQKDSAQDREQAAQDELIKLREKVEHLEVLMQRMGDRKPSATDDKRLDEVKERQKLLDEIKELNKKFQIQRSYVSEVEQMCQTLEEKNKGLIRILDETSSEAFKDKKKADMLTNELISTRIEVQRGLEQLGQLKLHNDHLTKTKVQQNLQILTIKSNLEHLQTQHNGTSNKLAKALVDLEYACQDRDKNKRDLMTKVNLLTVREAEYLKIKSDSAKVIKSKEVVARKYAVVEQSVLKAEEDNVCLRNQLSNQEKQLSVMTRALEKFSKQIENLTKERDGLKRDLLVVQKGKDEAQEQFKEGQHQIKSLNDTISLLELRIKKQKDEFAKLKYEKDRKIEQIQALGEQIDALQNEIHLKENFELELKRTISDHQGKFDALQAQCESVKSEKVEIQRSLQAVEKEKTLLSDKLASAGEQIQALQEKLSLKVAEAGKLQVSIDHLEKERRMLRSQCRDSQLGYQHAKADLLERKKENDRLHKGSLDDDKKLAKLKKECNRVIQEKNAVCSHLTKRNEEYDALNDRLGVLQAAYDRTEKQYVQALDDMRLMKVEIQNLRTEREVLKRDRECAADLRQELLQVHRVLNQERIKARALQDEMLAPMNVHRWRNLSGKDPEKTDLIQRIQILRKQVIAQSVTAIEREKALEETQKLYLTLKEFMLKLPSYKIKDQLNVARQHLTIKDKKLKCLIAEMNIKESDERTKESTVKELRAELITAKKELADERKRKAKLIEERQIFAQMQMHCFSAPPNATRMLGAGFKVNTCHTG